MAITNISQTLAGYQALVNAGGLNQIPRLFDIKSAQKQTQVLVEEYRNSTNELSSLQKESTGFMRDYSSGMSRLNQAAGSLTNGGVNNIATDSTGNVTEATADRTVNAMRSMVDEYNDNLRLLNDNAERGTGAMAQLTRMVDDPASAEKMELAGVSVNDDGTLALDEDSLRSSLLSDDATRRNETLDAIGGRDGVAAGIQEDARAGINTSSASLINNDISRMRDISAGDSIRNFAQNLRSSGIVTQNNYFAMSGSLLNMMV